MIARGRALRAYLAAATMLSAGAVVLPAPASAQVTTSQLRGQVVNADGTPAAGATLTARSTATNQTSRGTTQADGSYTLSGLRAGEYEVIATLNGETASQVIRIGVAQSASLDLTIGAAAAAAPEDVAGGDEVVITGSRLRETRTS